MCMPTPGSSAPAAPVPRPATPDPKMLGSGMAANAGLAIRSRKQLLDQQIEDASK